MRRDRSAPALYELIRGPEAKQPKGKSESAPAPALGPAPIAPAAIPNPQPAAPAQEIAPARQAEPMRAPAPNVQPRPIAEDAQTESGGLFAGGSAMVAVPVVRVWLGVGVVVLLLIGAYLVGYQQHAREVRDRSIEATQREFNEGVVDPALTNGQPNPGLITQTPTKPETLARGTDPAIGLVIIQKPENDPRHAGLNYFVLANLPRDEAERAARFVVDQGVAAGVMAADNRGLCQVVALRGFPAGTLDEKATVQFKERLRSIGRQYKREQKGPTDFADMFPKKHRRS